jgi:glycosyltransferase involved in cell wall biosynthesis
MLEAMALGLPCVAYDCPSGPRELSEEGKAAVLVPLNDRERLRAEIARLLVDPDARQRIGTRAAASVRQRYCLASILAEWDRLILAARGARGSAIA